ncbi:hypothetical protein F2Q69_00043631 [Brassica cretica]|uniref:Uncharacterized protein n=1 Tax=Brassica cretica TaxID=69181 RepID=A0A8S9NGG4_BRACR|nr:hypothetical protein F2Q69_00043631 [Brassica cretica]
MKISPEAEPSLEFAGTTACRNQAKLVTTDHHPRPPLCSSRRDEAVTTDDHAVIGPRTKPLEPPKILPSPPQSTRASAREDNSPPSAGDSVPGHRQFAAGKSPPLVIFRYALFVEVAGYRDVCTSDAFWIAGVQSGLLY